MSFKQHPPSKRSKGANGYSTQHVADLLGLSEARIRDYVRRDLLNPQRNAMGHFRFSFQDVVFLRAAKGLTDAAIRCGKAIVHSPSLKLTSRNWIL